MKGVEKHAETQELGLNVYLITYNGVWNAA